MIAGSEDVNVDDDELDLLVARINALYTKRGLNPPFRLRDAAKSWRGIEWPEILAVFEKHFDVHWRRYTSGSGDQWFGFLQDQIRDA